MERGREPTSAYRVQLDVFEGPLDLLLRLIERQEMDITQISLAQVADQYLEYISTMDETRPDELAEFLVIAAKLLLIKSRVLLPQPEPPQPEEEEPDIGQELVERLREYRKFKRLALFLREREEAGLRSYARLAPPPSLERRLEPFEGGVERLAAIMRQVLRQQRDSIPVDEMVAPIRISMADKMQQIAQLLGERGQLSFRELLQMSSSRLEIIVTFLALLEMIRLLRVRVEQEAPFGEILIMPLSEAHPATA